MIITTTPSIEGKEIYEYKGIVYGEIISGVNFIKDFGAGLRDIFGGRSAGYEEELIHARTEAIEEMKDRAEELGADAVLVNTAIAVAGNPVEMAKAFKVAVEAGRMAYEAGLAGKSIAAEASSPLTAFLK